MFRQVIFEVKRVDTCHMPINTGDICLGILY